MYRERQQEGNQPCVAVTLCMTRSTLRVTRWAVLTAQPGRLNPTRDRSTAAGFGYPAIDLTRDGEKQKFAVHRLVLLAFVGTCPAEMETRHLDGVQTNTLSPREKARYR